MGISFHKKTFQLLREYACAEVLFSNITKLEERELEWGSYIFIGKIWLLFANHRTVMKCTA